MPDGMAGDRHGRMLARGVALEESLAGRGGAGASRRMRLARQAAASLAGIAAAAAVILPTPEDLETRLAALGVLAAALAGAGLVAGLSDPDDARSDNTRKFLYRFAPLYLPLPVLFVLLFPTIVGRGFLLILLGAQVGLTLYSVVPRIRRMAILNGALVVLGAAVLTRQAMGPALAWLLFVLVEASIERFRRAEERWLASDPRRAPPSALGTAVGVAAGGWGLAAAVGGTTYLLLADLPGYVPARRAGDAASTTPDPPSIPWTDGLIVLGLIVLGAGGLYLARRLLKGRSGEKGRLELDRVARGEARPMPDPPPPREPREISDDRARIFSLYESFEDLLADGGLDRATTETPLEHGRRAARRTSPEAVGRVVSIFGRARYDLSPVGPTDVEAMRDAVAAVRRDLADRA